MKKERVLTDPLFTGMTRPPLTMGVPVELFGLNFMLTGVGIVLFTALTSKAIFIACVTLPIHAIGYVATERDPHWMRVWLTKLNKCPPSKNKFFWKSNSYKP